jgi:hypothetical protein
MAIAGMVAGCTTLPTPEIGQSPFVYPNAAFVSQTNATVWSELQAAGITNHADYVRTASSCLSELGLLTTREEDALWTDPFLSATNMPVVRFETFDPAERVAKYYRIQFAKHDWTKMREGLIVEETNGGGDWIRVFQKGTALVHIHIVGPWKQNRQEREGIANGEYSTRHIVLRFIGVAPSDVLGNTYQDKTWPDPTSGCTAGAVAPP